MLATPVGAIPEILERVEKGWLAADASPEAIAELLAAYLENRLPTHAPSELRCSVEAQYSRKHVLEQLVATALGEGNDGRDRAGV